MFVKNVYETACKETWSLATPLIAADFFRHIICFLGAGKYLTFYQYRQWNSAKLCVFLVGCHPSDSDLAIQFVDWCKWLVYVASLLAHKAHLLLFFVLIGLDIVKTLPRCYLQTYMEEPVFPAKKTPRPRLLSFEKNNSKCLKIVFACSGPNQAHNSTNIFWMNVLSNSNTGNGIQLWQEKSWKASSFADCLNRIRTVHRPSKPQSCNFVRRNVKLIILWSSLRSRKTWDQENLRCKGHCSR